MNRLNLLLIVVLLFAIGCNDGEESSPYDKILTQPPYSTLTDSIKQEPERDDLYFRRGLLLDNNNFPEPALADFKKAWSISKQERYALGVSGILLHKSLKDAAGFLTEAVKELPQSILLRINLILAYDGQDKTDEALKVANEVLSNQPDEVNILEMKSELLMKKKDSAAALTAMEKAHSLAPHNRELGYKLMYQYAESKNPKTITLADSLIRADSLGLYSEPYYVKGIYYSNINDNAKALAAFNETIRQDYNYLNAYIEKGKILFDQKKTAEAFKTFQLANTIDPAFPDAWYWMAMCQEVSGQKEDAKLNYQKAYSLDKSFTQAKEAADRIK